MRAAVSVPGKLILMGEHAAVYERPALVAAVGMRTRVAVQSREDGAVRIGLPDLRVDVMRSWDEVKAIRDAAERDWRERSPGDPEPRWRPVAEGDPSRFAVVALGEAMARLDRSAALCEAGLDLVVRSELPLGSGFGSSASIAVAVAAGVLRWADVPVQPELVAEIAHDVERRQHGEPSGVDHHAVLHGGVLRALRTGDSVEYSKVADPGGRLGLFEVFDSGMPREGTGAVVQEVRRRREQHPSLVDRALDGLGEATLELVELLAGSAAEGRLREVLRRGERCLEDLGVVPEAVQRRVRAIEEAGGAAKISGAGALTGNGAGCLLVLRDSDVSAGLEDLEPIPARLGVAGLTIEELP